MGGCFSKTANQTQYTSLEHGTTWSTAELTVTGYIREIENDINYIIPDVIQTICAQYFTAKTSLFICRSSTSNSSLDAQTSQTDEFEYIKFEPTVQPPYCYIPNVTHKNLPYEAILSFPGMTYYNYDSSSIGRTQITLFSQSNNTEIQIESNHNLSNKTAQFVYCGPKYGIICSSSSYLYQLKLNEINSNIDLNFERIAVCLSNSDNRTCLCYLDNYESLLVMSYHQRIQCKLFNLKEKQWITMKSCDLFVKDDVRCYHRKVKVCYSKSNKHNVYVVTNFGECAKFNVDKNEWSSVCALENKSGHDHLHSQKHMVWNDDTNPNMLYCAVSDIEKTSVQIFSLDISDTFGTWKRGNIQLISNLKQIILCGQ